MENSVGSYSDFQGLANLRVKAQKDEVAAAKEVGQQFEAFFIHEMLKSMRAATNSIKSDMWDSSATETYDQMFDEELAASMAKGQGIGITQWLVSQLEDRGGSRHLNKGTGLTEYLQSSQKQ